MSLDVALQWPIHVTYLPAPIKRVRVRRPRVEELIELADAGEDAILARACGVALDIASQFTSRDRENIKNAIGRITV